ncbi:MAG: serine protease [Bacteroidota bacterium]
MKNLAAFLTILSLVFFSKAWSQAKSSFRKKLVEKYTVIISCSNDLDIPKGIDPTLSNQEEDNGVMGTGFITGFENQILYITTAKHNVSIDGDKYENVYVKFHKDLDIPSSYVKVTTKIKFHPEKDIAVLAIAVDVPRSDIFSETLHMGYESNLDMPGVQYSISGHPSTEAQWSLNQGLLMKKLSGEYGGMDALTLSQTTLTKGYSGGAIFSTDKGRIIGMTYKMNKNAQEAYVYKIGILKKFLEKAAPGSSNLLVAPQNKPCHPEPYCGFRLSSRHTTTPGETYHLDVIKGDKIIIEVEGSITLGEWVGMGGPEGKKSGVFGMSLASYNLIRSFPHGSVLVGGLPGQESNEYKFCGKKLQVDIYRDQTLNLKFLINDKDRTDNNGFFDVKIYVDRQ